VSELGLIWSNDALDGLKIIHSYLKRHFSASIAERVMVEIDERVLQIPRFPSSGMLDPLLIHLGMGHRYVIKRYTRIVYQVFEDHIYITNVYDMRLDPREFYRYLER
jgi:plasmid stabilization system protein ParE